MNKTTWFTKKMNNYSQSTRQLIADMKYGKGIERFDKVMKIVEEAKTEREVVEKLKELDKI